MEKKSRVICTWYVDDLRDDVVLVIHCTFWGFGCMLGRCVAGGRGAVVLLGLSLRLWILAGEGGALCWCTICNPY